METLIDYGDTLPRCDFFCPLLSLPYELQTRAGSIPPPVALSVNEAALAAWKERVVKSSGPRIGVVWSDRPTHVNDHNRSIPLSVFRRLFDELPECTFLSLQKDPAPADVEQLAGLKNVQNIGPDFADYRDTAAAICHLDLIVSVDTSVVHLAATQGKPTWALLPRTPDFRWQLNRTDSPWYPTATLFRQPSAGDWQTPLNEIISRIGKGEFRTATR